jgi:signal transduction histidine kinase
VVDRGPGIPSDRLEGVFDAFTQAERGTTRSHEGLGIGLYLARRIMRAHGGDVAASTSARGTTMTFTFGALDED